MDQCSGGRYRSYSIRGRCHLPDFISPPTFTYTFNTPGTFPWLEIIVGDSGVITVLGCVAVCADPHFHGLDGVHYDFQGRPGETFAIISDPTLELNTNFIQSIHGTTVLGNTCARVCDHTLTMTPEKMVYVDGVELREGKTFNASNLIVDRIDRSYVTVLIPNRWNMRFHMFTESDVGDHINIDYAVPLYNYDGKTHGVLGHTMSGKPVPPEKCNIFNEGSCEVLGSFKDYEVKGDICSSEWTFTQFGKNCA